MSESLINRRNSLKVLGATVGMSLLPKSGQAQPAPKPAFIYSLNMSTIRGQELGFVKELEVASKAGFRSVEIWMDTFQKYLSSGGTLADARKRRLSGTLANLVERCERERGLTRFELPVLARFMEEAPLESESPLIEIKRSIHVGDVDDAVAECGGARTCVAHIEGLLLLEEPRYGFGDAKS